MKKILLAIAALMLSVTLPAQNIGGSPQGRPGNGMGMPPGGPGGGRPMGKPGDKKGKKPRPPKVSRQNKSLVTVPQMYAYAIGVTPGDSVIFLSDILIIKNAQLTKKTNFLVSRQDYSSQFRTYLTKNLNEKYRTCAIVFNKNLKSITKDYEKLKKDYAKHNMLVKVEDQTKFTFIPIGGDEEGI